MEFLTFATDAADRRQRSEQWRKTTGSASVSFADDHVAAIRGCDLGDIRVCGVTTGAYRFEDTRERHDGRAANIIKFYFQEEGRCTIEQSGRRFALEPGQWCAIDKDLAYSVSAPTLSRQIAISIPRSRLSAILDGKCVTRSFLLGAAHRLHARAETALIEAPTLGRRDRTQLGDALAHLLGIALQTGPAIPEATVADTRRLSVLHFIENNLSDPDLDIGRIADAMRLSKRTLHKLFADETSLARLIWKRRLERCRAALLDPAATRRPITEIAHDWGFADSQHFSRAFKSRYGTPPREFRNRCRLD